MTPEDAFDVDTLAACYLTVCHGMLAVDSEGYDRNAWTRMHRFLSYCYQEAGLTPYLINDGFRYETPKESTQCVPEGWCVLDPLDFQGRYKLNEDLFKLVEKHRNAKNVPTLPRNFAGGSILPQPMSDYHIRFLIAVLQAS